VQRRFGRRLLFIPLAVILLAVGAAIAVQARQQPSSTPDISSLQFVSQARSEFAGIPTHGNTIGYADAPVTIREYADLRCPVCREFDANVIPDVVTKLVRTHKAKLEFQSWPILGPDSVYASRAAYAAAQQNAIWPYAMAVYYNQGDEQVSWFDQSFARAVAQAVGLDMARFDHDLANASAAAASDTRSSHVADQNSFPGTPSVLVTGPLGTKNLATGAVPDLATLTQAVAAVSSRA
jgi:protein-disulfide isomerase